MSTRGLAAHPHVCIERFCIDPAIADKDHGSTIFHLGRFKGNVMRIVHCSPQGKYFEIISFGAEGETRTPTDIHPLDPEPSASTSSATSALRKAEKY